MSAFNATANSSRNFPLAQFRETYVYPYGPDFPVPAVVYAPTPAAEYIFPRHDMYPHPQSFHYPLPQAMRGRPAPPAQHPMAAQMYHGPPMSYHCTPRHQPMHPGYLPPPYHLPPPPMEYPLTPSRSRDPSRESAVFPATSFPVLPYPPSPSVSPPPRFPITFLPTDPFPTMLDTMTLSRVTPRYLHELYVSRKVNIISDAATRTILVEDVSLKMLKFFCGSAFINPLLIKNENDRLQLPVLAAGETETRGFMLALKHIIAYMQEACMLDSGVRGATVWPISSMSQYKPRYRCYKSYVVTARACRALHLLGDAERFERVSRGEEEESYDEDEEENGVEGAFPN